VTVAAAAPVSVPEPLIGATDTPMYRVIAVLFVRLDPTEVGEAEFEDIGVKLAAEAGAEFD
jgi:hypothetical protein